MSETYRKRGRVARWENGTLIRVTESGVAIEEGPWFTCRPEPEPPSRHEGFPLATIARQIEDLGVRIERLILTEGEATHSFGDREWRDESRRLHLSLTNGHVRALIDLADFDLTAIEPIAAALARAETAEREAPRRLRLAPNVTAAFLPSLLAVVPPNVTLTQRAGGIDGKGVRVEEAASPWPNWYRPSYRVRPVRTPFNLTATCTVTEIDDSLPRAIALLAPPDALTLRVLVVDGTRVYPATARVARIDAVGAATAWFPYGAGVWGAELVL